MASFTNQSKNNASWNNQDKSDVLPAGRFGIAQFDKSQFDTTEAVKDIEWIRYIRRGKKQTMGDLGGYTFNDEVLINDDELGETEIDDLEETTWNKQTKN